MSKQEGKCPEKRVTLGFRVGFNLRPDEDDEEKEPIIVSPDSDAKLLAQTIVEMNYDLEDMRGYMDAHMRKDDPGRFAIFKMIDKADFKAGPEGISTTFCLTEKQAERLREEWSDGVFNPDVFHEFTIEGKTYQGEWFYIAN